MGIPNESLKATLPPEAIVNCVDLQLAGSLVDLRMRTAEIIRLARMGIEGVGDQQHVAKAFIPESLARAKEQFVKANEILDRSQSDEQRLQHYPSSALSQLVGATSEIKFQPDFLEDTIRLFREARDIMSGSKVIQQGIAEAIEREAAEISKDGAYRLFEKIAPEWTQGQVNGAARRRVEENPNIAMTVMNELSQFAQQPSVVNILELSHNLSALMLHAGVSSERVDDAILKAIIGTYGIVPLYTGAKPRGMLAVY